MSMTISSTKTVGEIALELPQATRIFESMKIDYCCGGDRPVGEACSSAGVDFENLARMLEDGLVLVHTAVRVKPNKDPATRELNTLWYALVRQFDPPPPAADAQAQQQPTPSQQ